MSVVLRNHSGSNSWLKRHSRIGQNPAQVKNEYVWIFSIWIEQNILTIPVTLNLHFSECEAVRFSGCWPGELSMTIARSSSLLRGLACCKKKYFYLNGFSYTCQSNVSRVAKQKSAYFLNISFLQPNPFTLSMDFPSPFAPWPPLLDLIWPGLVWTSTFKSEMKSNLQPRMFYWKTDLHFEIPNVLDCLGSIILSLATLSLICSAGMVSVDWPTWSRADPTDIPSSTVSVSRSRMDEETIS